MTHDCTCNQGRCACACGKNLCQRGALTIQEQEAIQNIFDRTDDTGADLIPHKPPPTLLERFKRWIRA